MEARGGGRERGARRVDLRWMKVIGESQLAERRSRRIARPIHTRSFRTNATPIDEFNPSQTRVRVECLLECVRARAYTGEISALVCARSVWRRACTEHSQPLRNSAAFLFPRHAGQGRPTFSPDPPPIANRSNAITMRANFLDLFFFSDKTNL